MRNVSVAAREWKGEVVFLRKLTAGGANRSFGVEVAKLAGLPPAVVERARAILRTLESDAGPVGSDAPRPVAPADAEASAQLGLFRRDGGRGRDPGAGSVGGRGAAQGGRPRRAVAPRRARAHCRAGKADPWVACEGVPQKIDAKHLAWL